MSINVDSGDGPPWFLGSFWPIPMQSGRVLSPDTAHASRSFAGRDKEGEFPRSVESFPPLTSGGPAEVRPFR
jgi:hypothetical protein